MNVLVVNCGSSSLKFQLINSETEEVAAKGLCERIGIDGRLVYQPTNGEKEVTEAPMPTHTEAIKMVLDALVNEKNKSRLVQNGSIFHSSYFSMFFLLKNPFFR